MKALNKKAEQKAVEINKEYYTRVQLIKLINEISHYGEFQYGFYMFDNNRELIKTVEEIIDYLSTHPYNYSDVNIYIGFTIGDDLKVALDENGFFTNQLVRKDNEDDEIKHEVYAVLKVLHTQLKKRGYIMKRIFENDGKAYVIENEKGYDDYGMRTKYAVYRIDTNCRCIAELVTRANTIEQCKLNVIFKGVN